MIQLMKEQIMTTEKPGFQINSKRPAAVISTLAFALCVPSQIMGYSDRLNDLKTTAALVFLPVLSALLMIAVILSQSKKAVRFSVFPVFIGVLGFAFKLMMDPRGTSLLHHISAIVLYIGIIVLWALTVLFIIKTKWILVILFPIPFFKHLFNDDIPVLLGVAAPVPASTWFKEICILSFLLALFCFAVSLEKQ